MIRMARLNFAILDARSFCASRWLALCITVVSVSSTIVFNFATRKPALSPRTTYSGRAGKSLESAQSQQPKRALHANGLPPEAHNPSLFPA
jgi:hypothetical protein